MININVLPADTYTVINKTIINEEDKRLITMLYQPIIGYTAVSLYYTLLDDLEKSDIMSDELTHYHLMVSMQLKLDDILVAREKLEAIGLIKTYVKKDNINQYVYLLYSPISANDFFNHPILNVVLYNNLGKKEYEKVKDYFKVPKVSLKDYEDITASFNDVFSSVRGTIENTDNIISKNSNSVNVFNKIDISLIMSSIPKNQVNEKCFTDDVVELINNLSYIYNLDTLDMQGLIRNSINEKGLIDKNLLRKNCRNYYQFDNYGNLPTLIYNKQPEYLKKPQGDNSKWAKVVYTFENITPYQLLKAKYKGAEPTSRDMKLVESLLVDQKLAPGVVNVLISYILKVNNEKLNKSYVETIAGQWKRLNIETVEDAMRYTEKEHKKLNKLVKDNSSNRKVVTNNKKEEQLPAWFNKEQEIIKTTKEDIEEIDNFLKELV
ncbi:MAG: DnaD domain protein [Bacilli bacterium]|nr:DnaD domain protein [Bacilli bacterium]